MVYDHGFLILNKPKGISSRQLVNQVNRQTPLKVGHTGTLDPLATGMMVLAIGDATRFSQYLVSKDKAYLATVQFGAMTDTDDAEGRILEHSAIPIAQTQLEQALFAFQGRITQTPPRHSAIHINGKRAYHLARNNVAFSVPSREVDIHEIQLQDFNTTLQQATLYIHASSGTYIRSIARDLGIQTKSLAYLAGLERLWVSPFSSVAYDTHYTLDHFFSHIASLPKVVLSKTCAMDIIHGKPLTLIHGQSKPFAIFYQSYFLGILTPESETTAKALHIRSCPERFLNKDE